ncbi:MAG: hypothetical protein ACLP1D_10955 [Xanthobacteraceae bacterium]
MKIAISRVPHLLLSTRVAVLAGISGIKASHAVMTSSAYGVVEQRHWNETIADCV